MTMPDSLVRAAAATENPKKILFGKYELGRLLGCGAFAKVYHARTLPGSNNSSSSTNTSFSSSSVAIKIINKSRLAKPGLAKSNIRREVAILRRVRHPHIVRLVEVLASRTKIFFVLEFAKGGELFARISKTGRLPEEVSRPLFRQLISAVGYCHSRGVFHRDLKPENLLLDEHNNLKVSDFGLSALSADASRPPSQQVLHTLCGTPAYVAPEILSKKGYDGAKVDVWSCGVILFVLNAGYLPFNDSNLMNMYKKIYRGEYRIPKWTSPELRRLLSGILDTNPDTRMSVDEISLDPWFRKGMEDEEWEAMMSFHELEKDEEELDEEEMEGQDQELDHNRELNAFDLISFSSGVNLSGLFEPGGPSKERFVSREPGEGILGTVEEVGRKEGLYVRRRGKRGVVVVVEGHNGNFGVGVRVYRLNQEMVVVEVDVGGESWAKELWREKMAPAIKKPITIT